MSNDNIYKVPEAKDLAFALENLLESIKAGANKKAHSWMMECDVLLGAWKKGTPITNEFSPNPILRRTDAAVFNQLMEEFAQELSNAGCNDFFLPATDENIEFARRMMVFTGDEDETAMVPVDGQLILWDTGALRYLRFLITGKDPGE